MNECSSKIPYEEETRCIDGAAILKFNILGQGGALRGVIPREIYLKTAELGTNASRGGGRRKIREGVRFSFKVVIGLSVSIDSMESDQQQLLAESWIRDGR